MSPAERVALRTGATRGVAERALAETHGDEQEAVVLLLKEPEREQDLEPHPAADGDSAPPGTPWGFAAMMHRLKVKLLAGSLFEQEAGSSKDDISSGSCAAEDGMVVARTQTDDGATLERRIPPGRRPMFQYEGRVKPATIANMNDVSWDDD